MTTLHSFVQVWSIWIVGATGTIRTISNLKMKPRHKWSNYVTQMEECCAFSAFEPKVNEHHPQKNVFTTSPSNPLNRFIFKDWIKEDTWPMFYLFFIAFCIHCLYSEIWMTFSPASSYFIIVCLYNEMLDAFWTGWFAFERLVWIVLIVLKWRASLHTTNEIFIISFIRIFFITIWLKCFKSGTAWSPSVF